MVEGQFQGAGDAFERAEFAQAALVVAALVACQFAVVELRQKLVDVAGLELAAGEEDQLTPVLVATSRNIW